MNSFKQHKITFHYQTKRVFMPVNLTTEKTLSPKGNQNTKLESSFEPTAKQLSRTCQNTHQFTTLKT